MRGYKRIHSPHGYLHHGELLAYGDGADELTVPPLLVSRFAGILLPDLCQLNCSYSPRGHNFSPCYIYLPTRRFVVGRPHDFTLVSFLGNF